MDPEQFRVQGKEMVDFIADYISDIRKRDVLSSVEPGYLKKMLPQCAPDQGIGFKEVMKDVNEAIMPGVSSLRYPPSTFYIMPHR